jgi:hypothetical protein
MQRSVVDFPQPLGPQQRDKFAFADIERNAFHRAKAAEGFLKIVQAQHASTLPFVRPSGRK